MAGTLMASGALLRVLSHSMMFWFFRLKLLHLMMDPVGDSASAVLQVLRRMVMAAELSLDHFHIRALLVYPHLQKIL